MLLSMGTFGAHADNATVQSSDNQVNSLVLKETHQRNTLWLNTDNVSGLVFRPFSCFSTLDVRHEGEYGRFHPQQQASVSNNVSLHSSGATMVGRFLLLGHFSFNNLFQEDNRYNAIRYEIEDDMPFYLADTMSSPWTKQEYAMGFSIVSPIVGERFAFGLSTDYSTKVGAKQLDPRCTTYKRTVAIRPSTTMRLGDKQIVGLSLSYVNSFERSEPSLNNYRKSQKVYLMRGLGECLIGKVGDNDGAKDYFYRLSSYGGALSYSWIADVEWLAEVGGRFTQQQCVTNVELPKALGETHSMGIHAKLQALMGEQDCRKLSFEAHYDRTSSLEYVQTLSTVAFQQKWVIQSTNTMSAYTRMSTALSYDRQFGIDKKGYDWTFGASIGVDLKDDQYFVPVASFQATNVWAEANGGRQFKFDSSSLLLKLSAGYQHNLSGDYLYTGRANDVRSLYQADLTFYTAAFAKAGGQIAYTIHGKKTNYNIHIDMHYLKPIQLTTSRLETSASFGILF